MAARDFGMAARSDMAARDALERRLRDFEDEKKQLQREAALAAREELEACAGCSRGLEIIVGY